VGKTSFWSQAEPGRDMNNARGPTSSPWGGGTYVGPFNQLDPQSKRVGENEYPGLVGIGPDEKKREWLQGGRRRVMTLTKA